MSISEELEELEDEAMAAIVANDGGQVGGMLYENRMVR